MKIAAGQIDGFVKKPAPGIHAVLVYGPDAGLVTERAEVLIEAVAGTLDDAFRISEIGAGGASERSGAAQGRGGGAVTYRRAPGGAYSRGDR